MRARLRPCGDAALLVELPDAVSRRALDAALRVRRADGWLAGLVVEQVPAGRSVLVRCAAPDVVAGVAAALRRLADATDPDDDLPADEIVVLPVRYGGPGLEELARAAGTTPEEVVAWHTSRPWLVDAVGPRPGRALLVRDSAGRPALTLPTPPAGRSCTAGSVTVGAHGSTVEPGDGTVRGWVVGETDVPPWDPARAEPAALLPGRVVVLEVTG